MGHAEHQESRSRSDGASQDKRIDAVSGFESGQRKCPQNGTRADHSDEQTIEASAALQLVAGYEWNECPVAACEKEKADRAYKCGAKPRTVAGIAQASANPAPETLGRQLRALLG